MKNFCIITFVVFSLILVLTKGDQPENVKNVKNNEKSKENAPFDNNQKPSQQEESQKNNEKQRSEIPGEIQCEFFI